MERNAMPPLSLTRSSSQNAHTLAFTHIHQQLTLNSDAATNTNHMVFGGCRYLSVCSCCSFNIRLQMMVAMAGTTRYNDETRSG